MNNSASDDDCIFLNNHKCTIYEARPIICRTHGLPLLFVGEQGNWELSACELNFTTFNLERFNEENTFPQDKFNSKLFMLNKAFIKEFKDVEYGEFDLIPLKTLKQKL
jgi:Fe-S-cluster containining protein